MDTSSELVHSLLPVFMAGVLGVQMVTIGIVEGAAEGAAAITRVFSGALSDYFRKRKLPVVAGYALSALTKPLFPLASTVAWVFGARFADRIGKGIRGAPRDALIADITPPEQRGAAYGLRQALDSAGAFAGPLLALGGMLWLAGDLVAVMWIAVLPAFIAVLLLVFGLREPAPAGHRAGGRQRLRWPDITRLPPGFWLIVLLGAVFTLARFSEAFLILRARDLGLAISHAPLILIAMNIAYALAAYPAGAAADRLQPHQLLLAGLGILIVADVVLALANSVTAVFAGTACWGLHMALSQGLLAKLVADTAPRKLFGTAFGIFNLVSGIALVAASVIAGALWDSFGAPATFMAGALFAGTALAGLLLYRTGSKVR